jgi:hypothetical protein
MAPTDENLVQIGALLRITFVIILGKLGMPEKLCLEN